MIKLILADDHRMFRESIKKILTSKKTAEILAEAANGSELLQVLETHTPDLILMDISMLPGMDGIEATRIVSEKYPSIKVLVLSSFGDEKYYYSMIEAGAKGFVIKNAGLKELESAIIEVAKGGSWFSAELLKKVMVSINAKPKKGSIQELSNRELEILKLICESLTNEQIAEKLNISYDTVKGHRANILSKTQSTNTAGLVIYAIRNKIVQV